MFGRKKAHDSIVIEFYEKGASSPFYTAAQPIDQLPDTFQISTTLSIGGEDWEIWEAAPQTKTEFRQTGKLKLTLYKPVIKTLEPDAVILYSLPTINEDLAALEDRDSLENVFVVHEDDWRQQELISGSYSESIDIEMAAIRNIYATEHAGIGFKNIHLRSSIPEPLAGVTLSLRDIQTKLGVAHLYRGVAFSSMHAVIQRGYAFRTSNGLILWGQLRTNDEVTVACVGGLQDVEIRVESLQTFDALMAANNLLFVDWVQPVSGRKLSDVLPVHRT